MQARAMRRGAPGMMRGGVVREGGRASGHSSRGFAGAMLRSRGWHLLPLPRSHACVKNAGMQGTHLVEQDGARHVPDLLVFVPACMGREPLHDACMPGARAPAGCHALMHARAPHFGLGMRSQACLCPKSTWYPSMWM